MPLVNPTLPNDGETADAVDVSGPFLQLLAIFNGHIAGDNIEPGSLPWSVMASISNTITASSLTDSANIEKFRAEAGIGFIASGLIWSAVGGSLNGVATAGVYYSPTTGQRLQVAAIVSGTPHLFTASKDTYISISPTGGYSYQEVANGAAAPTLASNYAWVYIVKTNATIITGVVDIRQTKPFAIQESWTQLTLANGWVAFTDTTYEVNLYIRKDTNGMVTIKGIVKGSTATDVFLVAAGGLPPGYRPPKTVIYPCLADDRPARFDIKPDGSIKYQQTVGVTGGTNTPGYLSLAGSWYGEV